MPPNVWTVLIDARAFSEVLPSFNHLVGLSVGSLDSHQAVIDLLLAAHNNVGICCDVCFLGASVYKACDVLRKLGNLLHEQMQILPAQRLDIVLCCKEQVRELMNQFLNHGVANPAPSNLFYCVIILILIIF